MIPFVTERSNLNNRNIVHSKNSPGIVAHKESLFPSKTYSETALYKKYLYRIKMK